MATKKEKDFKLFSSLNFNSNVDVDVDDDDDYDDDYDEDDPSLFTGVGNTSTEVILKKALGDVDGDDNNLSVDNSKTEEITEAELSNIDEAEFMEAPEEDIPLAATTGLQGILDQKKQQQVAQRQRQRATNDIFVKWFQLYLNAIYKSFYTEEGSVTIKKGHEGGFINLDSKHMVIYDKLIIDLWDSGVPPLLVFYHEIGHLLFTDTNVQIIGQSLHKDVFHLLNWIEDYYIEERLMKEIPYIKPYIKMLHEVVPDFIDDWQKPHFAFNYYYAFEGQIPMWMNQTNPPIGNTFNQYIKTLLNLRRTITSKFAQQRFITELQNFYQFCVKHQILTASTPPPPTQPQPQQSNGNGNGSGGNGQPAQGSGRGTGGNGQVGQDVDLTADPNSTPSNPIGQTLVDPNDIDQTYVPAPVNPVYKPLDPVKGFDRTLTDLMISLVSEFDKQLFEAFKLSKKGKLELIPTARNTTSPRSMIDPVAIATNRSDIYLEYITEEQNYVGYNLFIDASGSVGFNRHYNSGAAKVIDIIKQYPHSVYSYNDKLTKWGPNEIKQVHKLHGTGGTESSLIAQVVMEKREAMNLNIVFSDGDLSYLLSLPEFPKIKDKYLFVFFCVYDPQREAKELAKHLDPKQFFCYDDIADIGKGLDALKLYIKTKGM